MRCGNAGDSAANYELTGDIYSFAQLFSFVRARLSNRGGLNILYLLAVLLEDVPVPEGGGLLKQSVIDEIAKLSLAISKQIAVATGVTESKVGKGKSRE